MKPEDSTWLAALLDGEGTISLTKSHFKPHYRSRPSRRGFNWNMRVHITNNNLAFLKHAQELAGGTMIECHLQPSRGRTNSKPWNNLFFNAVEQRAFLNAVYPYLIVKKRHAELYLEARDLLESWTGPGSATEYTDTRDKRMEALYWELRLLNAKGRTGAPRVQSEIAALGNDPRLYSKERFEEDIDKAKNRLSDRKKDNVRNKVRRWKARNREQVAEYNAKYYAEHKAELNRGEPARRAVTRLKERMTSDPVFAEKRRAYQREAQRRYREKKAQILNVQRDSSIDRVN